MSFYCTNKQHLGTNAINVLATYLFVYLLLQRRLYRQRFNDKLFYYNRLLSHAVSSLLKLQVKTHLLITQGEQFTLSLLSDANSTQQRVFF